jgi:uncharacterized delta-60 repeat protein
MKRPSATVQALERRALLSAYYLDPSFGDGGTATAHFRGASHFQASLVAEVDPQTVLIVGALDSRLDNVPRRLVMAQFDAHSGQLKGQFGAGGMLTSIPVDRIDDAQRLPDGRLLVLFMKDWQPFVARFTPAGTLDASFAGDGIAELDVGRFDGIEDRAFRGMRLRPAPDGKVVLLGAIGSSDMPWDQPLLARLTADGTLDKTFDGDGVARWDDDLNWLANIAVQADGKILLANIDGGAGVLRRFTPSGAVDPTFGRDGTAVLPRPLWTHSLYLLPDGCILTNAGYERIARLTPAGQLDASFGEDGTAALVSDVDAYTGVDFYVAPNGTFTVLNARGASRFTADGQPDPAFGIRGTINSPNFDYVGTHAILATNGDVLMSGYSNNSSSMHLGRFVARTDGAVLDVDGRLVVTGTVDADSTVIGVEGDQVRVEHNGTVHTFARGDVTRIRIDTDRGDDVIDVAVPLVTIDIDAGDGDDRITSTGGGRHTVAGGNGNDTIVTGDGDDSILAGEGDDSVRAGGGDDVIEGGRGDNSLDAGAGDDFVRAGPGSNSVVGGDGDDYLETGADDDTLIGGTGNDRLHAGAGNNRADGGEGDDLLKAGAGRDSIIGGAGNDRVYAGDGDNLVYAGTGDDYVKAGAGSDTLWGEIGYDMMYAGFGDDYVNGGAGKDRIFGQQGDDVLYGGRGNDAINCGTGADLLKGLDGNDKLFAADGAADTLDGGADDDLAIFDDALDLVLRIEATS